MSTEWTFRLIIDNQTGEELKVLSKDLKWGYWYINNNDKGEPVNVLASEKKEAFALRAAKGTATGYQGECIWSGASGTISLTVDVPFSKKNKSDMETTGLYCIEGWDGHLPGSGHQFVRSVTITKVE